MRYDWTPLWRSTIGFDRLFDVLDEVQRTAEESFPPYNIERLDANRFQISVALAGFTPDEVTLTAEQNVLTLEGKKGEKEEKTFLHRGISTRNFKRQFTLADHVEVKVFDVSGRLVRTLADRQFAAGRHSLTWDGADSQGRQVARGVYFTQVKYVARGITESRKLTILK